MKDARNLWRSRERRAFDVSAGKGEKCGPVGTRRVPAAVLAEGNITVDQPGLQRCKLVRAQISLSEQFVDWPCTYRAQEHALRIHPAAFHLL